MEKLYDFIIDLERRKNSLNGKYNSVIDKKLNQLYKKINLKKGFEPYTLLRLSCPYNHDVYFKWTTKWVLLKSCICPAKI